MGMAKKIGSVRKMSFAAPIAEPCSVLDLLETIDNLFASDIDLLPRSARLLGFSERFSGSDRCSDSDSGDLPLSLNRVEQTTVGGPLVCSNHR